jgi:hypothetical protein
MDAGMTNAEKFIADTKRSINMAALMLCGTDPKRQAKWVAARSDELRQDWRRQFDTMTPEEVERLVKGVMQRLVKRIAALEVHGCGRA